MDYFNFQKILFYIIFLPKYLFIYSFIILYITFFDKLIYDQILV